MGGPFVYEVTTARPSFVVLPDFAVDGWRVQVDGKDKHAYLAGPDFLGALVPKGRHTVKMWWATPRLEWICYLVSALTLLGMAGFAAIRWRRSRS